MILADAKTFGQAIRMQRKKRKITQLQAAAIANTGVRFISDLENGKPTVQLDKALRVAKIIGLKFGTSNDLLYAADAPSPYTFGADE